MNENTKCPKCGANIAPEWKHELCPACLMSAGFATGASDQSSPPVKAPDETKASENTYAPPPNAPLSIEEVRKLFPQLEIIEQIGRGGMGVVYKARQPQLDRMVALKILSVGPGSSGAHSSFAERFAREARALAKLNHPNIVSVFDFGQAGDHFYFIMEFVDGANLRQMIASKQITPETALNIVPKVCEALQFAHDEGILHRDIKPENILIDKKGRVKIADFGLAKLVDDKTTDHSLTGTHQVMGTPRYMAPEQFENTKTVDHRADIYSLGVVFYEMLTGEIPMGRFAAPSKKVQVDVRIDEVVLRSLEREPSQRYQHVSEVKTDVENVTHHGGSGGVPPPYGAGSPAFRPEAHPLPAVAPELRAKINSAGILMVFAGIAVALSGFVTFIYGAVMAFRFANQTGNTGDAAARAAGGAFEMLLITLCGIAVLVSGQAMRRLRFHSFALAMSVVLMALPLVLLLTFGKSQIEWVVFQLIFGVYVGSTSFRLLRKPEVETAFNAASGVPTTGTSGGANFQTLETPKPGISAAKVLLIVIGVVVGVSALMSGASLLFYMSKQQKPEAVITEDTSANAGAASGVHRMFRYTASAPVNHRATFWVEYWRDGKLDKKAGLTGGQMIQLPSRAAFEGGFDFSLADGAKTSPDAAGKLRWDFFVSSRLLDWVSSNGVMKVNDDASRGGHGDWIADPFAGLDVVSSWGKTQKWKVVIGEPVTVLVLRGYATGENLSAGLNDEDAKKGKATILLRARFDAVPSGERVEHSQTKTLNAADVEKLSVAAAKSSMTPATDTSFVIAQDRTKVPVEKMPGREEFAFTLSGPTGYALKVWAEIWEEGRMSILGGLDYHIAPRGGQRIETSFALATTDGDVASVESKGMMRLDWGLDGAWNNNQWRTNIIKGLGAVHRSWDREPRKWNPRPGEVVTILSITGYKISEFRSAMSVFTETDLIKGWPNAAIIVRAQFVPAKPGEIRDGEGPSVSINGLLNRIGGEQITRAQFEIGKQIGADLSDYRTPTDAHAALVAAASQQEGRARLLEMMDQFMSDGPSYSTDISGVVGMFNDVRMKERIGQKPSAEILVSTVERFIDETTRHAGKGLWWHKADPILKGDQGPYLSSEVAKSLKLTKPQHEEANKILQKYAQEARALERRHTKIERNDQGHVLVTISHYSTQCLALASNMVAELGGIVPQNILPAVRPGGLPGVVFGSAGECRTEIEMWRADGKYHLNVRTRDWLPAPGMSRSDSSFSNVGPDIGTFYGDYRLYWTEE